MFKLILIIGVVMVVLWVMRGQRPQVPPATPSRPADPPKQQMLACAQCGLHLPQGEALPGRGGVFCSEAHRAEFERAHPRE